MKTFNSSSSKTSKPSIKELGTFGGAKNTLPAPLIGLKG